MSDRSSSVQSSSAEGPWSVSTTESQRAVRLQRHHSFRGRQYSHTPTLRERLDQTGYWLPAGSPAVESVGPSVTLEEAANAIPSIGQQPLVFTDDEDEDVEMSESDIDDEGYESESESESEDEEDPKDPDYDPRAKGEWCREKGEHVMVRAPRP